ncbi:MAG: KTSC domain-containing protein, partial [Clostridia bacterium]|nr:KTSC domain-containing protein [Clostridia bacterium]
FSHVGYDKANRILKVRFRDSKSVYIYKNIPNEVYRALINASSIGSYYNNYIKNKYEYVRIE